jgi:hypothetical protein
MNKTKACKFDTYGPFVFAGGQSIVFPPFLDYSPNKIGMTPIEQLDYILKFMANDPSARGNVTDGQIEKEINPRRGDGYISIIISPGDIVKVLNKLVLDGYVHREIPEAGQFMSGAPIPSNKISRYSVTWEGKFFLGQGGYAGELKEKTKKELEVERRHLADEIRATQMTNLTYVLAAGTTVAALYYLAKGLLWFICELYS